ncbi:MAG: hypothetical protein JWP63_1541 [Candidatus Solibacter sp.]|nr:hypothetical protein [Candidatus Solibacter sp.]
MPWHTPRSARRPFRARRQYLKGETNLSHEQQAGPSNQGGSAQTGHPKTPSRKSAYLLGAASGVALALFAPLLRPAARNAVKSGIRVGRYAKKVASNVKEEFEDIAAEAQAEVDLEENSENGAGKA